MSRLGAARWLLWEQGIRNAPRVFNKFIPKPSGIKLPKIKIPKGKELLPSEKVAKTVKAAEQQIAMRGTGGLNPLLATGLKRRALQVGGIASDLAGKGIADDITDKLLIPALEKGSRFARKQITGSAYTKKELDKAYKIPTGLEQQEIAGTQPRTWQNPYGTGEEMQQKAYETNLSHTIPESLKEKGRVTKPATLPEAGSKLGSVTLGSDAAENAMFKAAADASKKPGILKRIGTAWKNSSWADRLGGLAGLLKIASIIGAKDQTDYKIAMNLPVKEWTTGGKKQGSKGITGEEKDDDLVG